jgi:hypothetical protein
MPSQFFAGCGGGHFLEVPAERLGPFFAGRYLGRGLARIDWNRDGREDFVISRLEQGTALVANQTVSAGHFLSVQLRGVTASRDAVGADVTVTAGKLRQTRQLTGGDGYLASNQRQLVFGLGDAREVDEVSVRWPGGVVQTWHGLPVDSEVLLIELRGAVTVLSQPASVTTATK